MSTTRIRPPGRSALWRNERLAFVLAALTAAVGAVVQVAGRSTDVPGALPTTLFVVAALLAVLAGRTRLRALGAQEERRWAQQVQGLLDLPPDDAGRLPRLSTTDPYRLGVSPSRYGREGDRRADPYVQRERDADLDRALRTHRVVLVVGDSKSGKSRTAYEAARRLGRPRDLAVLAPRTVGSLGPVLDLDPALLGPPTPVVLWLDDLTEGDLAALTPDLLDRLPPEVTVLGTVTAQRLDRVAATSQEIGRTARLTLARAGIVRLDSDLTDEELAAARVAYPEERFRAGIGEQLVAADQLRMRYENARQGAEPHGWAVVAAAVDWVRMDIGRPVRRAELLALYPQYLRMIRPTAEPRTDLAAALTWACTAVGSRLALLHPVSAGDEIAYSPADYLVSVTDGQQRDAVAIPDATWDRVPALTDRSECLRAGLTAYFRRLHGPARALIRLVADSGDPAEAPKALVYLGMLLTELGETTPARTAYRRAIASGHPDAAPTARVGLGVLLSELGDLSGAEVAYRQAVAGGHPDAAPRAQRRLGLLLAERGDLDDARAAYRCAIASGHSDAAPRALLGLATLQTAAGDVDGARATYRQVLDVDHPEARAEALVALGHPSSNSGTAS